MTVRAHSAFNVSYPPPPPFGGFFFCAGARHTGGGLYTTPAKAAAGGGGRAAGGALVRSAHRLHGTTGRALGLLASRAHTCHLSALVCVSLCVCLCVTHERQRRSRTKTHLCAYGCSVRSRQNGAQKSERKTRVCTRAAARGPRAPAAATVSGERVRTGGIVCTEVIKEHSRSVTAHISSRSIM